MTTGNVSNLRKKLDLIQGNVHQTLKVKSERIKSAYNRKARDVNFSIGQKVWFYNPQRTKGKLRNCRVIERDLMK